MAAPIPLNPVVGSVVNAGASALGVLTQAVQPLQAFGGAVASFTRTVVGAVGPLTGLTTTLKGLALAAAAPLAVTGALGAAANAVTGVGQGIAGIVEKANPAAVQRFTYALDDLTATFGKILAPVLDVVTQFTRLAADILTGVAGPLSQAVGAISQAVFSALQPAFEVVNRYLQQFANVVTAVTPAVEAVVTVFGELLEALRPLGDVLADTFGALYVEAARAVADALKTAAPYMVAFAKVLQDVVKWVSDGMRELLGLVGVSGTETKPVKPGSSVGAAARNTQLSDVTSLLDRARTSAYKIGTAAEDPVKRTASAVEEIRRRAEEIYDQLLELPDQIGEYILGLPDKLATAIKNAVIPGRDATSAISKAASIGREDWVNGITEAATDAARDLEKMWNDRPRWLGGS